MQIRKLLNFFVIFGQNAQIEIILNANILSVNFEEQHVTIDGHDKPLPYDKLLVATGSR